mgnify:CR=1 FL=1
MIWVSKNHQAKILKNYVTTDLSKNVTQITSRRFQEVSVVAAAVVLVVLVVLVVVVVEAVRGKLSCV